VVPGVGPFLTLKTIVNPIIRRSNQKQFHKNKKYILYIGVFGHLYIFLFYFEGWVIFGRSAYIRSAS